METWQTLTVFAAAFVAGALSGLAAFLLSIKPFTVRAALAATLFYALLGCGLGMFGYEYLDGKAKPWRIIGCAVLVGLGAIDLATLRRLAARLLGTDKNGP